MSYEHIVLGTLTFHCQIFKDNGQKANCFLLLSLCGSKLSNSKGHAKYRRKTLILASFNNWFVEKY